MDKETEYIASNQSYTNKDFQSIFPELLDLTKKLTNKYDPQLSNESDPLVVLYKLLAFIADKNNYNIDKNVLETFPLSVTQYGNARQLYDSLGYQPHWYMAASTNLSLSLGASDVEGDEEAIAELNDSTKGLTLQIPMFTMFTDSSGKYVYTSIEDTYFDSSSSGRTVRALQGTINDYSINGADIITLNHLDADLRLYFTDRFVAENGIFITTVDSDNIESGWNGWTRVNNLEGYELHKTVYKFGVLPNSDTCYIQFPQDISDLIDAGLKIKYISTSGQSGNVNARVIEKFNSSNSITLQGGQEDSNISISTSAIKVTNLSATFDGRDPETLEEAYRNFKKTVGTFNTLVTLKDYDNAIYNLLSDEGNPIISNEVTSDRTNDWVNAEHVVTLTKDGTIKQLTTDSMDAFKIGIYALSPMSNVVNLDTYSSSFTPYTSQQETDVKDGIESIKSSQHDYLDTRSIETYLLKNFYSLRGTVRTYTKLSKKEAKVVEDNIKYALYRDFNAREVDFGTEVSYEKLVDTIKNADNRISYVSLDSPQYILKYLVNTDTVGNFNSAEDITSDLYKSLLTRMVEGGIVQLYDFDHDFAYEFNRSSVVYKDIESVTSGLTIQTYWIHPTEDYRESDPDTHSYTLRKNELIYLQSPNYITKKSYGAYIKYKSNFELAANTYHTIDDGEEIGFEYKDSNGTLHTYSETGLSVGTMIVSNFDVADTGTGTSTIGAGQSVDVVIPNSSTVQQNILACWLMNNGDNELFKPVEEVDDSYTYSTVLNSGEYFIYTDINKSNLIILGSGTKLVYISSSEIDWSMVGVKQTLIDGLQQKGLAVITDDFDSWRTIVYTPPVNSTPTNQLTITEMELITLGQGSQLYGSDLASFISDAPQSISDPGYVIESGGEMTVLPSGKEWEVYSSLMVMCGPNSPQQVQHEMLPWSTVYIDIDEDDPATQTTFTEKTLYMDDEGQQVIMPVVCTWEKKDSASFSTYTAIGTDFFNDIVCKYPDEQGTVVIASPTDLTTLEQMYSVSQSIAFNPEGVSPINVPQNSYFETSEYVAIPGGENINIQYLDDEGTLQKQKCLVYTPITSGVQYIQRSSDGYVTIDKGFNTKKVQLSISWKDNPSISKVIIPFIKTGSSHTLTIKDTSSTGTQLLSMQTPKAYYLEIDSSTYQTTGKQVTKMLYFSWSNSSTTEYALMGTPYVVDGASDQATQAVATIHGLDANYSFSNLVGGLSVDFDVVYEVPDTDKISQDNPLSAKAFLDKNNPYSAFTIPQLNDTSINISVSADSIKL